MIVWIRKQFLEKSTQGRWAQNKNLALVPVMTSAMDNCLGPIPFPLWRQSEAAIPVCSQANTDQPRMRRLHKSLEVAKARLTGVARTPISEFLQLLSFAFRHEQRRSLSQQSLIRYLGNLLSPLK